MTLIKFGSYTPPSPTEYEVELQDIDSEDTGRGETGYMTRERVREGIYKVSIGFTNLTSSQVLEIKNAIKPEKISVELFDGTLATAQMYVGNRKLTLKSIDNDANCFWDMSFSLTEF